MTFTAYYVLLTCLIFQDLLEVPGRSLLYDDDLLEIDPVENGPIQRVHGYLLSDGFMLATWLSNR